MQKGDILKFDNYKIRGLSSNCYFYCKGLIDDDPIFVRCVIKQSGDILINNKIVDTSSYEEELVPMSIAEFIENKFNFTENCLVDLIHDEYDSGIIRKVNNDKRTLIIEVEDEGSFEYIDIEVSFDDISIAYPEFTYNDRFSFRKI